MISWTTRSASARASASPGRSGLRKRSKAAAASTSSGSRQLSFDMSRLAAEERARGAADAARTRQT
mgnify:CR=1 FL=1